MKTVGLVVLTLVALAASPAAAATRWEAARSYNRHIGGDCQHGVWSGKLHVWEDPDYPGSCWEYFRYRYRLPRGAVVYDWRFRGSCDGRYQWTQTRRRVLLWSDVRTEGKRGCVDREYGVVFR
jgi:hypothetical protein